LPVLAPDDVVMDKSGQSPLATHEEFRNTTCPIDGQPARREADTMDTFTDSSWYFMRMCDPFSDGQAFDPEQVAKWLPVDQYIGGIEHAILHLLYARFYQKALIDIGYAPGLPREPFARYVAQGMIRLEGSKMSKSKGNLIAPEAYYETVGADGLRLFHLFAGPPVDGFDWTDQTEEIIEGCGRFIERVFRLVQGDDVNMHEGIDDSDRAVRRAVHRTIERVGNEIDRWSYNTAVASIMELVNTVSKWARSEHGAEQTTLDEAIDTLLKLLAPMTPHITAELWEMRYPNAPSVHSQSWPVAQADLVKQEATVMVVQINGKVRARIDVALDISEEQARASALDNNIIREALAGAEPQRVIVRAPRLVNIIL
jgi:leucyl-tRNA synthetase